MAEVDERLRSPARRRHHSLLPLPLPLRRRTRRDGGRIGIHRSRRSGDDVPPLLRVVIIPAMMSHPSSVGRPPSTPHVGGACAGGRRQSPPSALQGQCPSCPPPSLVRAEDGRALGDAILAVLVLEAVVVVALDVLEKFQALQRRHCAVVLVVGPYERRHDDVTRGEGHGGWWSGRACRLPPS